MKKQIFAGIGLGLLVGTIIGLSISQVTGIILGALTSLLASFFGLQSNKPEGTGNQVIIGTFSISCLLAIFFGLWMRTHDLFSPSVKSEFNALKEASFDSSEIKKIILFKEFGLVPVGYQFSKEAKELNRDESTVLMGKEIKDLPLCNRINDNSSLQVIKDAFVSTGGSFQDLVESLSASIKDTNELRSDLLRIKNILCKK